MGLSFLELAQDQDFAIALLVPLPCQSHILRVNVTDLSWVRSRHFSARSALALTTNSKVSGILLRLGTGSAINLQDITDNISTKPALRSS